MRSSPLRELLIAAVASGLLVVAMYEAHARTGDGWKDTTPQNRAWFQSLMQPDAPKVSCCGEADAYEADDFEVDGDHYIAVITDTRSDTMRNGKTRPHIAAGTRIYIPNGKLKIDAGNPTGHGWVFIGETQVDGQLVAMVYCYVQPAGA